MKLSCFNIKQKSKTSEYFLNQNYAQIVKDLQKQDKLFEDNQFPLELPLPNNESLVEWRRPDIEKDNPILADEMRTSYVVNKNHLTPNWMTALLVTVRQMNYFKHIGVDMDENLKYFKDGEKYYGMFQFRFFIHGDWKNVIIDDRLPYRDTTKLFTHLKNSKEYWEGLFEKAMAKVMGSYENLKNVNLIDAVIIVVGGYTESIPIDFSIETHIAINHFTTLLNEVIEQKGIILASPLRSNWKQANEIGLSVNRYYLVTNVSMAPHLIERISLSLLAKTLTSDKPEATKLMELRDPENSESYIGPFNKNSMEWKAMDNFLKNRYMLNFKSEQFFWIPYTEFINNFEKVFLNFPEFNIKERLRRVNGTWKVVHGQSKIDVSSIILNNDQYLLNVVSEDGTYVRVLLIKIEEGRPDFSTEYMSTDFGLKFFRIEYNRLYRVNQSSFLDHYTMSMTRTNANCILHGFVERGNYLLVPWIQKCDVDRSYCLQLYITCENDIQLLKQHPRSISVVRRLMSSTYRLITRVKLQSVICRKMFRPLYAKVTCENTMLRSRIVQNPPYIWNDSFIFYRFNPENNPIKIEMYCTIKNGKEKPLGFNHLNNTDNQINTKLEMCLINRTITGLENDFKFNVELSNYSNGHFADL